MGCARYATLDSVLEAGRVVIGHSPGKTPAVSVSVELLRDNVEPEDIAIFSSFTLSATFWLLFSTLIGVLISFKFPCSSTRQYRVERAGP